MGSSRDNRRLVAVMFTDRASYVGMNHRNELLSLELLREHRATIRPLLESFQGREMNATGDSFMAEFSSADAALRCGLAIQEAFAERNHRIGDDRHIEFRIGIHVGDVFGFDDEIEGDGVNIAIRLQPLAPIGGICISQAVYEQIQFNADFPVHSMGMRKLRGIRKPIRVYSVDLNSPTALTRLVRKLSHRPKLRTAALLFTVLLAVVSFWSRTPGLDLIETVQLDPYRVAVLPFDSAGLPENEAYLSDGLTEALISGLSKKGVHVLARASVARMKKSQLTPEEMGHQLKTGTLVTGVMIEQGNLLRITVSLIDMSSRELNWSGVFQGRIKDLPAIQDKIVSRISKQFKERELASTPFRVR